MSSLQPRLITFDLGGTLIAPSPSVGETYAEVIRTHGFPADAERLNARFPAALKRWTHALHPRQSARDARAIWSRIVHDTLSEEAVPSEAFDRIFNELFEAYARGNRWKLLPQVHSTLSILQARGLRLAVLSNSDSRMRGVLADLSLMVYFEAIFLSGEVGYEKPDIRLFQHIARTTELEPEAILHVGDSARHDAAGAKAAGWRSILLDSPARTLANLPHVL